MKNAFKISLGLAIILFVVLTSALAYIRVVKPELGHEEELTLPNSTEFIERGRYLSHHVAACFSCHSPRDWSKYSGPVIDSLLGSGGLEFGSREKLPGHYYSRNITPTLTQKWKDRELYNAIATGITADQRALFPTMPYLSYGLLDSLDILSIAAYIRTLKPIETQDIKSESDFPMSLIIRLIPRSGRHKEVDSNLAIANPKDSLRRKWSRGEHLTELATCKRCHSQQIRGKIITGLEYSGKAIQYLPSGDSLFSSNITSDSSFGIGAWSKEKFIAKFKNFKDSAQVKQTNMPWSDYQGMSVSDLGDIFDYLQSLPALDTQ
jgi:cytochrome c553